MSPVSTASTMQCSRWSLSITSQVPLIAERTAASWMRTSAQSRPSSTMFRTAVK